MNKDKPESRTPVASKGWAYATLLFLLAPLVGEFLLGNLPITWLWVLMVLAPLYGGGAILIRETARRWRLGWPGILLLGLAYALVEEAFVTQSLFNPDYVGLRLLDYGYIPAWGIGSWWTVFVLSIHVIWSTATPIALVEALSGKWRRQPWLGAWGLVATVALFVFGCVASALASEGAESFRASASQFIASGVATLVAVVLAVLLGRRFRPRHTLRREVPAPVKVGAAAFAVGSAFMLWAALMTWLPAAVNVVGMLLLIATGLLLLYRWGRSAAWTPRRELAFAGGFLCVYAWYGFVQIPSVGDVSPTVDAAGNAVFATGALVLLWWAWRKVEPV